MYGDEPTELPIVQDRRSLVRKLWDGYRVTRVMGYDQYGTAHCELRYRRWHPGYWWFRLHPPAGYEVAVGETELSPPISSLR